MFVPDLMHEIELGTWKGLFTHLIHILVAHGGTSIQKLNDGYRAIPTFGQSTIRRFSDNASSMKKLAARNFEDLLQVGIRQSGLAHCVMLKLILVCYACLRRNIA